MKREIKFRFWLKEAYNHDIHEEIKYKMIYPHDYKDRWYVLDLQKYVLMEGEGGIISDFPMEVMEFTGLLDKNGKEIYEGDIIPIYFAGREMRYVVSWYNNHHCFALFDGDDPYKSINNGRTYLIGKCEVIGNKYENPELLNN